MTLFSYLLNYYSIDGTFIGSRDNHIFAPNLEEAKKYAINHLLSIVGKKNAVEVKVHEEVIGFSNELTRKLIYLQGPFEAGGIFIKDTEGKSHYFTDTSNSR